MSSLKYKITEVKANKDLKASLFNRLKCAPSQTMQ